MRVILTPVLLVALALAGCSDGSNSAASEPEYPSAVAKIVAGVTAADLCGEVTGGEKVTAEGSSFARSWGCEGAAGGSLRIASYNTANEAATWVAQSQMMSLCSRLQMPLNMENLEYGELLLDDASVMADLDTLALLQAEAGGHVYDRREPFPPNAEPLQVEPVEGCGEEVGILYPMNWEEMRGAFAVLP